MKSLVILSCIFTIISIAAAGPPLPLPGDDTSNLSLRCQIPKCPEPSAANKEPVTLPYPIDCLQYIICEGTKPAVVACPPDLFFNKNTGVCEEEEKANCVPCYQQG